MKKRILALLIACLTVLSFSVSAADSTISVGVVDASDVTGNILVPIKISEFHTTTSDTILGISGFQLKINFDKTKLKAVKGIVAGDVPTTAGSPATWSGLGTVVAVNNANKNGNFTVMYADQTGGGATYAEDVREGKDVLFYVAFTKLDGAEGDAEVSVEVTSATMMEYIDAVNQINVASEYGVAAGKVILTKVPSKPETTVVKTFPKRFYADNAITTVGVILEGTDYDNATEVKAGIKTQRDEVNVNTYAPGAIASATDEDKSYIMVTLGEITETTVFQPTTPTWAFVEIDGTLIEGEKVTENVTSADDAGAGEDYKD